MRKTWLDREFCDWIWSRKLDRFVEKSEMLTDHFEQVFEINNFAMWKFDPQSSIRDNDIRAHKFQIFNFIVLISKTLHNII